jgi:hypothetical protein
MRKKKIIYSKWQENLNGEMERMEGRKRLWPALSYCPSTCLGGKEGGREGGRKTMINLSQDSNTKQEC